MEWEMYLIYGLLIFLAIFPVGGCLFCFLAIFWYFILDERRQESILKWAEDRTREMEMEE